MAIALATHQLEAISGACRRHHVARMEAFGSVLTPSYRPGHSDIDLLVEFQPCDPGALYQAYFGLLNELRETLATGVDLVMADAVSNPYIRASIEASKLEIYAA